MASPITEAKDVLLLNNLALRLYRELIHSDKKLENFVFSPTTLLTSLYELHLASHGHSREQVDKLLKIPDEVQRKILHDLTAILGGGDSGKKDRHYDFFTGTKILAGPGVAVLPKFTEELKLAVPGGTGDALVSHVETNEAAVEGLINQLAKDTAKGKLGEFGKDAGLKLNMDKNSLLFLSVARFYSDWEKKFEDRTSATFENQSREKVKALPATVEDFHNLDGTAAKVVMVHLQGKIFLTRDEDLKVTVLELPMNQYCNNLLIVLPDDTSAKGLKHFEDNCHEDFFEILRKHWQMPLTHVYLPRFSLENHFSFGKNLQNLGVKDVFTQGKADLSNFIVNGDFHVADVLHAASLEISCEAGTAVPPYKPRAGECSGVLELDTFAQGLHINRPFFFLVRPRHPELWSLVGRVVNLMPDFDVQVRHHHKHQKDQE